MRRRPTPSGSVPPILASFDPAEWWGTADERYRAWRAARQAFSDQYGWPGGPLERIWQEREARGAPTPRRPRG